MDVEFKSERIQNILLGIANDILIENEILTIQTPSLVFSLLKLSSDQSLLEFKIQKSTFLLPVFCVPKNEYCNTKMLLSKVKTNNWFICYIFGLISISFEFILRLH